MRLRTRLNLVVAALSAAFVIVLIAAEIQSTRDLGARGNRGGQPRGLAIARPLASVYSQVGGPDLVLQFLQQLGRVRANEVYLLSPSRRESCIARRRPPTRPDARRRPGSRIFWRRSPAKVHLSCCGAGVLLVVEAQPSRAVLDAWDDVLRCPRLGRHAGYRQCARLLVGGARAQALSHHRRRPWSVSSKEISPSACRRSRVRGHAIGAAFNRMAQAVEDKVQAERKARDAETRLEERREMASLADQRVEEERRLIAHELHDEFGQSVTAIRSLALAIASQGGARDPATGETARLISDEAARLYDAMHGLIPRLAPLSLDTLGLAATLESLVRDWQRRHPSIAIRSQAGAAADLGPSITLAIYRVVQEGLINALRHARPSRWTSPCRAIRSDHRYP
jgi:two-component system sensor histidine kinase UhpB